MHALLSKIALLLISPLILISGAAGYHVPTVVEFQNLADQKAQATQFGSFNPTGGSTYKLSNSVGLSNSSVYLTSFKEPVSNIPYTMTYLGSSVEYGTIAPQSSVSEFVSFTGITQNSDGTAVLTGVSRGLSRSNASTGCVASTTLAQTHPAQTNFILSDSPCLFSEYYVLRNNATSTGTLTFTSTQMPRFDTDPGAAAYTAAPNTVLVDMAQLTRTAIAGASNATRALNGLVQVAFRGQAASSTPLGSTGAFAVLTTDIATSSPSIAMSTSSVVMTRLDSRIDPSFFATTTGTTYAFGNISVNALSAFLGNASFSGSATTTFAKGLYANLIAAPYFDATSTTATSTFPAILTVSASTTNMNISGQCTGCIRGSGYEVNYAGGAFNAGSPSTVTLTASCTTGKVVIGGGATSSIPTGCGGDGLVQSSPNTTNTGWTISYTCGNGNPGVAGVTAICVNP